MSMAEKQKERQNETGCLKLIFCNIALDWYIILPILVIVFAYIGILGKSIVHQYSAVKPLLCSFATAPVPKLETDIVEDQLKIIWNEWGEYSKCSVTCGTGEKVRTRNCRNMLSGGTTSNCNGQTKDTILCIGSVQENCPIDGNWMDWGNFSACSTTCGEGIKTRIRLCYNPPPRFNGAKCVGQSTDNRTCTENPPCAVDGNWAEWSLWGDCSVTCGTNGRRTRSRTCSNPPPAHNGLSCVGIRNDVSPCTNVAQLCPEV